MYAYKNVFCFIPDESLIGEETACVVAGWQAT